MCRFDALLYLPVDEGKPIAECLHRYHDLCVGMVVRQSDLRDEADGSHHGQVGQCGCHWFDRPVSGRNPKVPLFFGRPSTGKRADATLSFG